MKEVNKRRKKELEIIAETCDYVPENPPRTFYEALQSFWFIHLIYHLIEVYSNGCEVRFDQLMYPFYKKDEEEEGRIKKEEAQELLEFLWLKFEELAPLLPPMTAQGASGGLLFQTLNLGGVTPQGEDVTNERSYA